jgi:membrane associated rhomboid family serine protease
MRLWTYRLIAANVVVFVLTSMSHRLGYVLDFMPAEILSRPWGIVTYMFVHANTPHILFNMLGLYFFGPRVEIELGEVRFLTLYFLSGISGALFSLVLAPGSAIVGASAAEFGVFLAFAYYWPRTQVYVWGVIPVEARYLVVVWTVLSLFGGFGIGDQGIAHFAHLGGYVGAYAYLRFLGKQRIARLRNQGFVPPPKPRQGRKSGGQPSIVRSCMS